MKKNILYIFLLFIFCSCASELENVSIGKISDSFSFYIDIKNDPIRTKVTELGDESLNENKIDRLDVFFYSGETCVFYPVTTQLSIDQSSGLVDIKFSSAEAGLFDNQTRYNVYVVANTNINRSDLTNLTLSQLKQKVQTSDFTQMPNANFLMDGNFETKLPYPTAQFATVNLKRAAVKIRPEFDVLNIPGYTFVSANIVMNRYLDKTSLLESIPYNPNASADLKNYSKRNFPVGDDEVFYTYETSWDKDIRYEPFLRMEVRLKNTAGVEKNYYYKLSLSFLNSNDIDQTYAFKLLRNKIYGIGIQIRELGSENPENPLTLTCNYLIKDWTTKNIEVNISNLHYLVVFETQVNMYNTSDYKIGYAASTSIEIKNKKAYYNTYNNSGVATQNPVTSGWSINVDATNSKILINSTIPNNYVPREFEFTVSTVGLANNLTQLVKITQYPPIYITSQYSSTSDGVGGGSGYGGCNSDYPNGASGQTNFNLYKITVLVNDLSKIPNVTNYPTISNYVLGDPSIIESGTNKMITGMDAISNNIISPQFVIASQRGITLANDWNCAFCRCKAYREGTYSGGKWRIPTKAEIQIVDMIQDDPNSAVKTLLIGTEYWSARSDVALKGRTSESYRFTENKFYPTNSWSTSGNTFPVRCIT
ncbi:MAG: fimbrial protein, partial [Bacteroidales bacterium]